MSDKPTPATPQQQKPEARLARRKPVDFEAIDSLMAPRRNYLIDKMLNDKVLTEAEIVEMRRISDVIHGLKAEYYRPILADLWRAQVSVLASLQSETEAESEFDYERMANNLLLAIMNAEKELRPNEKGVYSPLSVEEAESSHRYLLLIQHYDQNKRLMATYGVEPYIVPDTDETEAGE